MRLMLTEVSREEFYKSDVLCRVIVHDHAKRYAKLQLANGSPDLMLSWRSDLVEPVLAVDPVAATVWVGVDERAVAVSKNGQIVLSIGLISSILDINVFPEVIVFVCDGQLVLINCNFSFRSACDLRDLPEAAALHGTIITVRYIDGREEDFSV